MAERVVLITGAASGIGRAAAELYAGRGYSVVAVDADAAGLAALTDLGPVATLTGDVATVRANEDAVDLAQRRFGRLDAVLRAAPSPG